MKNKKIKDIIASNLREYRKQNGYTQKELANELGVSHNTISSWENGTNSIDIDTLVDICSLFHVTLNDMYNNFSENESAIIEEPKIIAAAGGGLTDADERFREILKEKQTLCETIVAANLDKRQIKELIALVKTFEKL